MIDIHNHILPGLDDGPTNEDESLDLAKAAVQQGIHTVVATPHHKNGHFDNYKNGIETSVQVLNELLQSENIPLKVLPGQEVRLYGDIIEDLKKGEILTVNHSDYLLIEFPFEAIPYYAEQLLYDIQVAGYTPVIVHPERNHEIQRQPNKLYQFILKGALAQVTAGSLFGSYGSEAEASAHQLMNHNLIHLVSSDAHHVIKRPFQLEAAYEVIKANYGIEFYSSLLENSQLLVDNMNVNRYEPSGIHQKKHFFQKLWRKK